MEIQKSLSYGWKKLKETWWWVSLTLLYGQIGGLLYLFAGFTAMKFTGNPELLSKFSYNSFQSSIKLGIIPKNVGSYFISLVIMFLMLYFFAGYLPSKKAANKNHNVLMLKVAIWFFIINVAFAALSALVMKSANPSNPNMYSKSIIASQIISQMSGIFSVNLFIGIALISYIYEKFSEGNAVRVLTVYFIFALLPIVISSATLFTTYLPTNHGAPKPVSPLFALVQALIFFVIYSVEIFVLPETALQNDLTKGFQRGFYLMREKGRIIFFYLILYVIEYAFFYICSFLSVRNRISSIVSTTFYQWLFGMLMAFVILSSFRLAYLFENKDELFKEPSADENQQDSKIFDKREG